MITLTRRQVRRLRGVFRRSTLGITHRGPAPPIVLVADPGVGLRVRHLQADLAVESVLTGNFRPEESIALPLDSLADFEGRDDSPVVLEAADSGRTVIRWDDRGIPQTREYPAPDLTGLPPFPGPPDHFETNPATQLDALADAVATAGEASARFALDSLRLGGDSGVVAATDGRQVLFRGGFRFPWAGDVLVRRTPLFASKALPRDRPVAVGRTDGHVSLRVGDVTLWLATRDARFPKVEDALPDGAGAATRLRLADEDAAFLGHALDRLPGGDDANAPVTLDLNGRMAVRARAGTGGRVAELILNRSSYTGPPVRLSTCRHYLARAVRLGFDEIGIVGPDEPLACRDGDRVYFWQPLSKESAIGPDDDAVRVVSTASVPPGTRRGDLTNGRPKRGDRPEPKREGADPVESGNALANPTGLAALIAEAVGLHRALADARARARSLVAALRREQKRSRRVRSTLATLRQLQEVVT